jgi:hypothetical protein
MKTLAYCVLYFFLGAVMSDAGISFKDWQFWAIMTSAISIAILEKVWPT